MAVQLAPVDADAIIDAEYEEYKDEVVGTVSSRLAASRIRFADLDLDGFYNQAWYGLYTKLREGEQIDNHVGMLVQMTYRRAIDEFRTLHPDRRADPVVLESIGTEDPIEETLDQREQFSQFVEGMRTALSERELQAATLCYVYGMTRPEAAVRVGVRPKRMEKIMDEVSRKLRPLLESIKQGSFCADRAALINQFALGALDPESAEYQAAAAHLEHCPGCRRHVLGTRGLTAVTVPSGLMLLGITSAAVTAGGAAGAAAMVKGGPVVAAAKGGAAAHGAGSVSGGAAATGAGASGFGIAQAAAVVSALVIAAGGAVAVKKMSSGGDKPAAVVAPALVASESGKVQADRAAARKLASKKRWAARKRAAEHKRAVRKRAARRSKAAATKPKTTTAPKTTVTTPTPTPAPQQTTPQKKSSGGGSGSSGQEFDLR